MNRYLPAALVLGLCLGGAGCANSREGLMEQEINLLDEATDVLRTVNTQATLDAAKPKLTELVNRHKTVSLRTKRLKKATDEEKEAMQNKYGGGLDAAKRRLSAELPRLDNLDGGREMQKKLNDMMNAIR
jgi:hypothetical protein